MNKLDQLDIFKVTVFTVDGWCPHLAESNGVYYYWNQAHIGHPEKINMAVCTVTFKVLRPGAGTL